MKTNLQHKKSEKAKAIIPEGWEIETINSVFDISAGGDIQKENVRNKRDNVFKYPVYANAETNEGLFGYSNLYKIDTPCLTITGRGDVGIAHARFEPFYPIVRLLVLKPRRIVDLIFFENCLNRTDIHKESTGVPQLTAPQIAKYKILSPPLPEQRTIAVCLSTWDKAINKTQALIVQKEYRKKWLMQQLLTGKKRLKGFGGEWREYHIRDVANEVSIRNKEDREHTVLSCTKYDGLVPSLEYFGRKIFSDDLSTYKVVPKNHFAYATNHIEEGSIGYQSDFEEALISPMYTVFKTDSSINDYFFYKLLKSHHMIFQYNARMEGSIDRRGGLRWDAFSIIKVSLPDIKEQTAIARVLQAADKEIQTLKQQLQKLKEQKKGLMQVLLTGKKRLKIK